MLDSLAAVFLPSDCRVCAQPLLHLSRLPVCEHCLASLEAAGLSRCRICGEAVAPGAANELCGICRRVPPQFDFAVYYGAYDGTLRRLVHLLKYERLRPAANVLGEKLAGVIAANPRLQGRSMRVIPAPLHRSKERQRGFNQAESIARVVIKSLGNSALELHTSNLRRVRATVSQTGLTRHQRRENVRGVFVLAAPERIRDRSILLVDDVYTTGTTLNECARVLRRAGAQEVVVATVARVYREALAVTVRTNEENKATVAMRAAG